jgi:hypothetical protein
MPLNKTVNIAWRKTNAMANLDVADEFAIDPGIDSPNANVKFPGEITLREKCCRIM